MFGYPLPSARRKDLDVIIHTADSGQITSQQRTETDTRSTTQYNQLSLNMEPARRAQPINRQSVAKASLTRMKKFIEASDLKVNEIKVRLDKLPSILSKYESTQDELECLDEADYSLDREEFETQYYLVEAKFNEILHPVVELPT
jgi:hypothetical protein